MKTRNLVDIRLHQNDLPDLATSNYLFGDYLYRANGEVICDFCKIKFKHHPYYLDTNDHQICNGDVVHL